MREVKIKELEHLRAAADESGPARLLGMSLIELKEGYAKARMRVSEDHLNFFGLTHGAILYGLADHVNSAAANSLGRRAVMTQSSTYFLANPKVGQEIFAEGRVTKSGRKLSLLEVCVSDGKEAVFCRFIASCYFLDEEPK